MIEKLDVIGLGLANTDMVTRFDAGNSVLQNIPYAKGEHMPLSPEEFAVLRSSVKEYQLFPGGSVANSIRNLAALGHNVGFCGAIGDDGIGRSFADNLKGLGAQPFMQIAPNTDSRICMIMVHEDGERTMFGIKDLLYEIDESQVKLLPQAEYIMVEGNIVSKSPCLLKAIINTGSKIILTLSGMDRSSIEQSWLRKTLLCVDVLFCNKFEYESMDFKTRKIIPDICVKTLGGYGCEVYEKHKWQSYGARPVKQSDIANATGAGDAFASGFISALLKKHELDKRVAAGNKMAARVMKSEWSYISR
ncbi:adenosine kinase [Bacteroidia bacterium]|nr:adenosine kinase [Bacteroidia bacterium]